MPDVYVKKKFLTVYYSSACPTYMKKKFGRRPCSKETKKIQNAQNMMKYVVFAMTLFVASAHKPLFTEKAANARWLGTVPLSEKKKNETLKNASPYTHTHTHTQYIHWITVS